MKDEGTDAEEPQDSAMHVSKNRRNTQTKRACGNILQTYSEDRATALRLLCYSIGHIMLSLVEIITCLLNTFDKLPAASSI